MDEPDAHIRLSNDSCTMALPPPYLAKLTELLSVICEYNDFSLDAMYPILARTVTCSSITTLPPNPFLPVCLKLMRREMNHKKIKLTTVIVEILLKAHIDIKTTPDLPSNDIMHPTKAITVGSL